MEHEGMGHFGADSVSLRRHHNMSELVNYHNDPIHHHKAPLIKHCLGKNEPYHHGNNEQVLVQMKLCPWVNSHEGFVIIRSYSAKSETTM